MRDNWSANSPALKWKRCAIWSAESWQLSLPSSCIALRNRAVSVDREIGVRRKPKLPLSLRYDLHSASRIPTIGAQSQPRRYHTLSAFTSILPIASSKQPAFDLTTASEVQSPLLPKPLPPYQRSVRPALHHQLPVPAGLHDPPPVHHANKVRPLHRREPVRDDHRRAALAEACQRILNRPLRLGVERAGGPPFCNNSSSRMGASRKMARARVRRWRWPPERRMPRSPMTVFMPCGRSAMKSVAAAAEISASVAEALVCRASYRKTASHFSGST